MNAQLAALMDEIGLKILIDDFVGRAHYHPDITRLPIYADQRRIEDVRFLYEPPGPVELFFSDPTPHRDYELFAFTYASPVWSPFPEDATVHGSLFRTHLRPAKGTVILAHGGYLGTQPKGADLRPYFRWAIELARNGSNTCLPALPRHLDRAPSGTFSGERFLSGNLLETIDAIEQAVGELEALVAWLSAHGEGPVGVMGMSLGGLTTSQLLSVGEGIEAALLVAPVPDAPRSLFESPIGRTIRVDWVTGGATREDLEAVFAPLSSRHRRPLLSRDRIKLAYGAFDEVVLPDDVHRMGRSWETEVWEAQEGHLGLISSNELRHRGSRWFAEMLERAAR